MLWRGLKVTACFNVFRFKAVPNKEDLMFLPEDQRNVDVVTDDPDVERVRR